MKRLLFLLTIILGLGLLPTVAQAVSLKAVPSKTAPTAEPSAVPSGSLGTDLKDQINQLKDKIASKVAELNLVEKRGISGSVMEVSGNKITLTDIAGKTRFIDVDEITKFSSDSAKGSFGLSDLTKGTIINILGLYNKESKHLLARFINVAVNPTQITGTISDLDTKNYSASVETEDKKQTSLDISTTTKISVYTKTDGLSRYGFSKLTIGDRIIAIGYPDKKDPTILVTDRIIAFPELPKNPNIVVASPSEELSPVITESVKPSTGSGKKLTPITKTPVKLK